MFVKPPVILQNKSASENSAQLWTNWRHFVLVVDLGSFPEVEEAIEKYDNLLRHIFQHAIPVVQSVLQEYPSNLDVKTEGRRFFYNYSRMTQFT